MTLIRGTSTFETRIVTIRANGVTFGRINGGFTIAGTKMDLGGGAGTGAIDGGGGDVSDVTIAGNVVVGNTSGISTGGASRVRIEGNAAIDNEVGFRVLGPENVAIDSVVMNNVASNNATGFSVGAAGVTFTDNAAIGNEVGIEIRAGTDELSGNTVIGNSQVGFKFLIVPQLTGQIAIHRNNIYGNGDAADGCGVTNDSGGVIDATNNYWGKANGPGPNPGDRAHGTCLVRGSIVTTPFASAPFPTTDAHE